MLNVIEEVIEVINCKLIWMPAGNKEKTQQQEIFLGQLKNFVVERKKNMC